jgi:UDP-N-acetylglucosamine 3-dehydrogenase
MNQIRTILLGCGGIGVHHCRILKSLEGVALLGVVDPVLPQTGVPVYKNLAECLQEVDFDAAVVATPISTHYELGRELISQQKHVLMEKPLSDTSARAAELIQLARQNNTILMAGHSERFNPAYLALKKQLQANRAGQLYRLEAMRTGPYPQKIGDRGAVMDLAIHDMDLISDLLQGVPLEISAMVEQRINPEYEDGVTALMAFANQIQAQLTVNWLSPRKHRVINVYGYTGMFHCDLFRKTLTFFENCYQREQPDSYGVGGIQTGAEFNIEVANDEPLALELKSFFAQIKSGHRNEDALVSALYAVELGEHILKSAREKSRIPFRGAYASLNIGDGND